MEPRDQEILLFVGRKKTGKTTLAKKLAATQHSKVLCIHTFPHPAYAEDPNYKRLLASQFHRFTTGKAIAWDMPPLDLLAAAMAQIHNAFVICEDSTKYIRSNVSNDVINAIIDHRNKGLDLVFMFHSLLDVPPFLARNYNRMVLFKTDERQDKVERMDKFPNIEIVARAHEAVERHPSEFYNQVIDFQ
jgi:hypothetical protein